MATLDPVTIRAKDVMRQITLRVDVTGLTVAQWRMCAGLWLIRLAARVAGLGIEIVQH